MLARLVLFTILGLLLLGSQSPTKAGPFKLYLQQPQENSRGTAAGVWQTCSLSKPGEQRTLEYRQQLLRERVLRTIRQRPHLIQWPDYRADGCYMYYRFGRHKQLDGNFGTSVETFLVGRTPLEIPLATQFRVEIVRRWEWPEQARKKWEPYLERIENSISRELAIIAEYSDDPERVRRCLYAYEQESATAFRDGFRAVCYMERRMPIPLREPQEWQVRGQCHLQTMCYVPVMCCDPCEDAVRHCCSDVIVEPRTPAQFSVDDLARAIIRLIPSIPGDKECRITYTTKARKVYYLPEDTFETLRESKAGLSQKQLRQEKASQAWRLAPNPLRVLDGATVYFCVEWPDGELEEMGRVTCEGDQSLPEWTQRLKPGK